MQIKIVSKGKKWFSSRSGVYIVSTVYSNHQSPSISGSSNFPSKICGTTSLALPWRRTPNDPTQKSSHLRALLGPTVFWKRKENIGKYWDLSSRANKSGFQQAFPKERWWNVVISEKCLTKAFRSCFFQIFQFAKPLSIEPIGGQEHEPSLALQDRLRLQLWNFRKSLCMVGIQWKKWKNAWLDVQILLTAANIYSTCLVSPWQNRWLDKCEW